MTKQKQAGPLAAADVKKIRAKLKLTTAQLAEQIGVHVVTVRKWEAGLQRVGAAHAKLLRLMVTMQK